MKVFPIILVVLATSLATLNPIASASRAKQDHQAAPTCEEARAEVARFKDVFTTWGSGKGGDSWRSTRYTTAAGESLGEGFYFYKSKSRFKKTILQFNKEADGVIVRTLLLDDKGREIGQRIVKETRVDGKVTSVLIRRITGRMIWGISAPSLKLALSVEKANITCRG
jgi:hypothetical protein